METYLVFINLTGLAAMWLDKALARSGARRLSEKSLFLLALLGGAAGVYCGMYLFRHKTRHRSFTLGIPLILTGQILLVSLLSKKWL